MKKLLAFLITVCLAASMLTGCAGTQRPAPAPSSQAGEDSSEESSKEELPLAEESSSQEESSSSPAQSSGASSDSTSASQASSSKQESSSKSSSSSKTSSQKPSSSSSKASSKPKTAVRVTIPEGWTFMQIAKQLEKSGVCSQKDFYKAAQSYTVQSFNVPSSSNRAFKMEGYLFPDTYDFYTNDDPVNVLRKMLNNYAAKSGMPSNETLILASIIEQEARSDEHMKLVSSVFHNRLKKGMQLQADPTINYVNNFITGNSLLTNTSKYAALYNTYKCQGLPAGPICNPGARAIAAAKNPTKSDYLYFFFKDGKNYYSKTLEEHEQKMKEQGLM